MMNKKNFSATVCFYFQMILGFKMNNIESSPILNELRVKPLNYKPKSQNRNKQTRNPESYCTINRLENNT